MKAGAMVVLSSGNRNRGGRSIRTGTRAMKEMMSTETEGEIPRSFPPAVPHFCTSASHWLSQKSESKGVWEMQFPEIQNSDK